MSARTKIRKIMVPIDGSSTSMKAARIGISLSKKYRSGLVGLAVIDLTSLPYGYFLTKSGTTLHNSLLEEKRSEAEKWLNDIKVECEGNFRSEIIENPSSKIETIIIDYAERESVDLMVMGTRGKSGFKRALLGSVASGVISYARCPVMIVR